MDSPDSSTEDQRRLDPLLAENRQLREWIENKKTESKQWNAFLALVVIHSVIFTLSYDQVVSNAQYEIGLWVGFLLTIAVWHGLSLRSFGQRWKRTLVAMLGVLTPSLLFHKDHPLEEPTTFLFVSLIFGLISVVLQSTSRWLRYGILAPGVRLPSRRPISIRFLFLVMTTIALWFASLRWYLAIYGQTLSYQYLMGIAVYTAYLAFLLAILLWFLRHGHLRHWILVVSMPLFAVAVCLSSLAAISVGTRLISLEDATIFESVDTFEEMMIHLDTFVYYSVLVATAPTITALYLAIFGHRIVDIPNFSLGNAK